MSIKDLLFPKFCLGCGYIGTYICSRCASSLEYVKDDICLYCQHSSLFGFTHPVCQKKYGLDGILSIFSYNNLMKKIIKNIKYRLATEVLRELESVVKPEMLSKILFYKKIKYRFYLQPIPLHLRRLRDRGFNQALLLAQFFNRYLDFDEKDILIRKKETLSQATMKETKDRYFNMLGAFALRQGESVSGKNFILIDDVATTGATIKEAAKILKKNGANKVFALTLAKG